MTPFVLFRRWAREGPAAERAFAAVAALCVTVLVAWALVPTGDGQSTLASGPADTGSTSFENSADGGAEVQSSSDPGEAASGDQTPEGGSSSIGGGTDPAGGAPSDSEGGEGPTSTAPAGPAGETPEAAGSECDNRATDTGVSDKEVLIGIVYPSLGEANPALGIPPKEDFVAMFGALFDHYNAQGGLHCRKMVPKYYEEFVLDSSSARAACLQMQQDGIFALVHNLFAVANRTCPAKAGIPNFWYTSPDVSELQKFPGRIFSFQADYGRLIRDYVLGAKQEGYLDGLGKLGLMTQTCFPERVTAMKAVLGEAGIGSNKISEYNYGCPSGLVATPDQQQSAALQFQRVGVTHVMSVYREGPNGFAQAASRQRFQPKYIFMDDQFSSLASNGNPKWDASLDGARIITKSQDGAEYTKGATFSPATAECEAIAKKAGVPGPTETGTLEGALHGAACSNVTMLVTAARATQPLTRTGLAQGLVSVGKVDLSFSAGPSEFKDPANPTGGQFWRPTVYRDGCSCVQVLDFTWRPQF